MASDDLLTTAEAAQLLDLSWGRVKQLVQQQRLHSVKIGRDRLLRRADVEEFAMLQRKVGRLSQSERESLVSIASNLAWVYRSNAAGTRLGETGVLTRDGAFLLAGEEPAIRDDGKVEMRWVRPSHSLGHYERGEVVWEDARSIFRKATDRPLLDG